MRVWGSPRVDLNARPLGLTMFANAPQLPGVGEGWGGGWGGGGWAQLELTNALHPRLGRFCGTLFYF